MPFDGSNVTEVQLTLIAARALVKKGWCRNAFYKELTRGDQYCILGAIRKVVRGAPYMSSIPPEQSRLEERVKAVFMSVISDSLQHIESWNDQRDRKKSEVLAAFDRAIAIG